MPNALPKATVQKLENWIKKGRFTNISSLTKIEDGYEITFTYNMTTGLKIISSVKASSVPEKTKTPTTPGSLSILDQSILDGTVTKSRNWYKLKGKNYNGTKAITQALTEFTAK